MENSLPCRKWHVHGPLLAMNCRTRLCLCPEPGPTVASKPCLKQLKLPERGREQEMSGIIALHILETGWGSPWGKRMLLSFPAAQNADGGARHAQRSAHATAHGSEARESPARPSLHMARCMSLQGGGCRAALPLAIQLVAGSFLEPVSKSGGWRRY